MPVAEYKMHKQGHRRLVPDFIDDRGHWFNPVDHTYIGWVEENPDHYVPDTIVFLTKDQFVARALAIHADSPFRKQTEEMPIPDGDPLTEEEVILMAGTWYDEFVAKNTPPAE
jgi:hypothetical protein